jgi:hypothetical protein
LHFEWCGGLASLSALLVTMAQLSENQRSKQRIIGGRIIGRLAARAIWERFVSIFHEFFQPLSTPLNHQLPRGSFGPLGGQKKASGRPKTNLGRRVRY